MKRGPGGVGMMSTGERQRRFGLRDPASGRPLLPFLGTVQGVARHKVAEESAEIVPRHFMVGVGYLLQKILQGRYYRMGLLNYTRALFLHATF